MITAYASKEQKRYHEKSEIDEKSMEDFREEIKNKTKREQILKEQKQSKSRLIFDDEGKDRILGSGMVKRSAVAVENVVSAYGRERPERIRMIILLWWRLIRLNLWGNHLRENPFTSDSV